MEGLNKSDIDEIFDSLPGERSINIPLSIQSKRTIIELKRLYTKRLVYEDDEREEFYKDIENLRMILGDR